MPGLTIARRDVLRPRGMVLLLHGGQERGLDPVDARSTSWHRAALLMRHIAPRAHAAGVAVWLLRYRHRGWNAGLGDVPSPVLDAREALEQVRRDLGPVPVVLVGHSMGARTGVAVADDPSVTGVVALAPWLPPDDPVQRLAGKHFAAAHGTADRITSATATRMFVRRAEPVAATAEFADMGPVGHYLLRRVGEWNRFATSRALRFLPS